MKLNLLRNALANLAGGLIPAVVTLLTLPYIVRSLGSDSYGVLVLITSIVGYFSVLDLNVTAGSIKFVAEHHATGNLRARNQTIVSGLGLYAAIGLAGCLLILYFCNYLIINTFSVPEALRTVSGDALRLAAAGFFFGQIQVYLQSVPQAIRRYDWTASVESAFGIIVPLGTVAVLWLGYGLYEVMIVRVIASMVNVAILACVIRRLLPDLRFEWPKQSGFLVLARFSGYSYLSRLASVAYAQGDKLIIGATLSMTALAQYAVPFMLVNRLYALTFRLGAVLFPVASALHAAESPGRLKQIYLYGVRYTLFFNSVIASLLAVLSRELLHYWMGPEIAIASTQILALLAIAALLDSISNVPSLVNDGVGHPRVTGLFAVARASMGLGLTFVLASRLGVVGAAYAQLITAALAPAVFLWFVHGRTIPVVLSEFLLKAVLPVVPLLVMFYGYVFFTERMEPLGLELAAAAAAAIILVHAVYGFLFVFRAEDRMTVFSRFCRKSPAV